jgi:ABC-2 type transport system permease protein
VRFAITITRREVHMAQIEVEGVARTYRIAEREPGMFGAMRGLLHRRYRAIEALKDVSFNLQKGELLGLIGPNGAGKSTTIKILSGILRPSAGKVIVNNRVPFEDRIRHVTGIGVVFGQRSQLPWDLPMIEGFDLLRDIYRDPEIANAVRKGGISYDRLRPVDTYACWYVRAMAWMTARALPRAVLMFAAAGIALPLVGLHAWAWKGAADATHAALFTLSLMLMILLGAAFTMLLNVCITATLTDRGINTLATSFVILFSGNLVPLSFYPDWAQLALFVQPFAGMLDIPMRIYIGAFDEKAACAGLSLQAWWTLVFIVVGRAGMRAVMNRLEVQGG